MSASHSNGPPCAWSAPTHTPASPSRDYTCSAYLPHRSALTHLGIQPLLDPLPSITPARPDSHPSSLASSRNTSSPSHTPPPPWRLLAPRPVPTHQPLLDTPRSHHCRVPASGPKHDRLVANIIGQHPSISIPSFITSSLATCVGFGHPHWESQRTLPPQQHIHETTHLRHGPPSHQDRTTQPLFPLALINAQSSALALPATPTQPIGPHNPARSGPIISVAPS
jgi:hypothetical protein